MTDQRAGAPRSIVELDVATGTVRMGQAEQRVRDLSDPEQLYPAYLSLLYAVRGARRGEEIPLRSADVEALLQVVGDDPDYIERKLVELMGCTEEEASLLRRMLLRHRALAAGVGVATGLSLVALLGSTSAGATPAPGSGPGPVPVATITPADPSELPPLPSYATTDTGEHVAIPDGWTADPEVAAATVAPPAPVAPAATRPATAAETAPAETAPAETAPAPAATSEVVLGEPMTPIDRAPAGSPTDVVLGEPMLPIDRAPAGSPTDVVLGEPMTPIDRPGWSPEDEVVLGEPMTPIDRPAAGEVGETAPSS